MTSLLFNSSKNVDFTQINNIQGSKPLEGCTRVRRIPGMIPIPIPIPGTDTRYRYWYEKYRYEPGICYRFGMGIFGISVSVTRYHTDFLM